MKCDELIEKIKQADDDYRHKFIPINLDIEIEDVLGAFEELKQKLDKAIAELEESQKMEVEQLLMEIVELKEKYKELAKLHDKSIRACCDADKVIAHHKYKRCLAMAKLCHERSLWWYSKGYGFEKYDKFWEKWEKRWRELADKFKEAE